MRRDGAHVAGEGDHGAAFRAALLANVNAGGENCHRGSALGALFGAAVGLSHIPAELTVRPDAHIMPFCHFDVLQLLQTRVRLTISAACARPSVCMT